MADTSALADPVINVIEPDISGRPGALEPAAGDDRADRLDTAAMDALSARRRREFDAARTRLRDQAARDEAMQDDAKAAAQPLRPDAGAPDGHGVTARAPLDEPPERVRKRYLRAGNQYFLKEAPYQLAFEDLGPYLVTEHNRPDVVESMVDMVAAKSWHRIRVSGHDVFRSEVWLHGTLLGIEVSGYEPKAADLARLADARKVRLNNRVDVDTSTTSVVTPARADDGGRSVAVSTPHAEMPVASRAAAAPAPRTEPLSQTRQRASQPVIGEEPDGPRRYAGELREHGRAPYQNNPARSDSYYVAFRDDSGVDHVVWGVDLERAMSESGAQPGQPVTLENLGRRLVTVRVPVLDDRGAVVGEEEKDVHRNTWQVDVKPCDRSVAAPATGAGRMSAAPGFADEPVPEQGNRSTAHTISEEDRVLHLAVLSGAMREQGFSARSIARVQQRAEQMLVAFGRDGVSVPRPKVFDPKAPSERDRRTRQAAGRAPSRERERAPEPSPER